MRERAEIIARGEVQRVGYRDVVERAARKLKLTGFVENVTPYDVRIVCEGERSSIDALVERIKIKEHPIDVEELEVRFEPTTGEFAYFAIKRGEMAEELGERMDVASSMLHRSVALSEESVAIGRKMLDKQDVVIETLDHTTALLKENTDTLKGFRSESNANFELLHQDNRELKELMAKHALTTEERIETLATEICAVKERLDRLEAARAS